MKINQERIDKSKKAKSCTNCIFYSMCYRRIRNEYIANDLYPSNAEDYHEKENFLIWYYVKFSKECLYYVCGNHNDLGNIIVKLKKLLGNQMRGEVVKEIKNELDHLKELKRKAEYLNSKAGYLNSNLIIQRSHLPGKWVSFIKNSCYLENDLVYIVSGIGATPDEALENYYKKISGKKLYLIAEDS